MAKRRKASRRRRGRRMSGVGAVGTNVLSMVAGAVIGRVLQNRFSSKINPKILAAGQVGLGLVLPRVVKNKFAAGVGSGMIISGALSGLQSFGVISAISGMADGVEVDYMGEMDDTMDGTDRLQEIAGDMDTDGIGLADPGIMSGSDSIAILAGDMDDEYDI